LNIVYDTTRIYLDFNAPLVVKADPLVSFGGVRNALLLDPMKIGSVQEPANLAYKQNQTCPVMLMMMMMLMMT